MPRVYCNLCNKGFIKVPFAVRLLTFSCPKCNGLATVATDWERQRIESAATPAVQQLSAIVTEVEDWYMDQRPNKPEVSPPAKASAPVVPSPASVETALTSPHLCTQCRHPIRSPLGLDRATVVCPSCCNRTSLYAVIFRCSCGVLLESPIAREEQTETCPACKQSVRVPADVARLKPDEPPLEDWFRFQCVDCEGSMVARRADAGAWAVCPRCRCALEVPRIGEALTDAAPDADTNPGKILQAGSEMHCPGCGTTISTRAERCHICGRENT